MDNVEFFYILKWLVRIKSNTKYTDFEVCREIQKNIMIKQKQFHEGDGLHKRIKQTHNNSK